MKKPNKPAPVAMDPAPPAPAPLTHVCPKCQTAVNAQKESMVINGFGYQGIHCLKCWMEMIKTVSPQLVPLQAAPPVAPDKAPVAAKA